MSTRKFAAFKAKAALKLTKLLTILKWKIAKKRLKILATLKLKAARKIFRTLPILQDFARRELTAYEAKPIPGLPKNYAPVIHSIKFPQKTTAPTIKMYSQYRQNQEIGCLISDATRGINRGEFLITDYLEEIRKLLN